MITENIRDFVESMPSPDDLRTQLARNLEERDLIKKLLRLAEQREKVSIHRVGKQETSR